MVLLSFALEMNSVLMTMVSGSGVLIRHSVVLGDKAAFTGRDVEFSIFTLPGSRARVVGLILRIYEAVVGSLPAPFTP